MYEASPSETIRVIAQNAKHASDGEITENATLLVNIEDSNGTVVETEQTTLVGDSNNWWVDIDCPSQVGIYRIQASLTLGSAVWKSGETLVVKAN